jgi:hypothetical protein
MNSRFAKFVFTSWPRCHSRVVIKPYKAAALSHRRSILGPLPSGNLSIHRPSLFTGPTLSRARSFAAAQRLLPLLHAVSRLARPAAAPATLAISHTSDFDAGHGCRARQPSTHNELPHQGSSMLRYGTAKVARVCPSLSADLERFTRFARPAIPRVGRCWCCCVLTVDHSRALKGR